MTNEENKDYVKRLSEWKCTEDSTERVNTKIGTAIFCHSKTHPGRNVNAW